MRHDAGLIKDDAQTVFVALTAFWIMLIIQMELILPDTEMFCHFLIMLREGDLFGFIFKLSLLFLTLKSFLNLWPG